LDAIVAPDFVGIRIFEGVEGVSEVVCGEESVADKDSGDVVFEGEEIDVAHALRGGVEFEKVQEGAGVVANVVGAELMEAVVAFHKGGMGFPGEDFGDGILAGVVRCRGNAIAKEAEAQEGEPEKGFRGLHDQNTPPA